MIIEQNRELEIMRFLVKYWYKYFSAYEIAKETEISAPTVYKIIKKFEQKELLKKDGKKIQIDFNNFFAYSFNYLMMQKDYLN